MLGVDPTDLKARWAVFEPDLEAGQAPRHSGGLGPELRWVRAVAAELGVILTSTDLARIEADWDFTRRQALLDAPPSAVATLAAHVDVVALSHEIGACKPDPATYAYALNRLKVSAGAAAYVGDGSSDELVGARAAGLAWSSSLRRPQPS
jgi:hypothetical protein